MRKSKRLWLVFLYGFAATFTSYSAASNRLQSRTVFAALTEIQPTLLPQITPDSFTQPPITVSIQEKENAHNVTPVPTSLPTAAEKPVTTVTPTSTPAPRAPSPSPSATAIATTTPEPTTPPPPTATPDVWVPAELEPIFARYAGEYGIDQNVLERIANCESHFNTSAGFGDYLGMFQFASQTWVTNRALMGLDTNPDLRVSAEESIRTAAFVISRQGGSPWPSCL